MKKVLLTGLAVILTILIAACGTDSGGANSSDMETTSQTLSSTSSEHKAESSETGLDMITGTLYAPFAQNDIREIDFGYEEGSCTPERIAAALTGWTGLIFDISATVENDTVIVDWKSSSSFAEGQPPAPQKEDFEFYDQETMRWFMLNSLCSTIRINMGISDVFYSIEGGDLNSLGLEHDFNPSVAYNRINNPNIVIVSGVKG